MPNPEVAEALMTAIGGLLHHYREEGVTDFADIDAEIRRFDRDDGVDTDEQMLDALRSAWEMGL